MATFPCGFNLYVTMSFLVTFIVIIIPSISQVFSSAQNVTTNSTTDKPWITTASPNSTDKIGQPNYKALFEDLFRNYNNLLRPVIDASVATNVTFGMSIIQLIDVVRNVLLNTR
ncbi:uncharacterized protein LOC144452416 [Glandiceps talaboti]